jgi:endoglucanase
VSVSRISGGWVVSAAVITLRSWLLRLIVVAIVLTIAVLADGPRPGAGYASLHHPFRGRTLFLDTDSQPAAWQQQHGGHWLDPIVRTPRARWLTGPGDIDGLAPVLRAAQRQHTLPVMVAYYIPDLDCAGPGHGAADAAAYGYWIRRLVARLGSNRVVVILEPDAVASACFDGARAAMLSDAVRRLSRAGQSVYLDAGNSQWRTPQEMAVRLRSAGIAQAEGFSVNVASRESTMDSQRYAVALSKLVGDREAIIDTSRNGLPPPPDDQWCNAEPQALGQPPTTHPGLPRIAALLWVKEPGESDGACGGGIAAGVFLPRQARTLIVNSPWVPGPARHLAAAARPPKT